MQFSSLQDVPALLSCCFKDGSERAENLGTSLGSETPRDLLSYFRVSEIPLCLTIRERWKGVRKKNEQNRCFMGLESQSEIVWDAPFRSTSLLSFRRAHERRLVLAERNSLFASDIKPALDILDCLRADCVAVPTSRNSRQLQRDEQHVHLVGRPYLLPMLDQCLQLSQDIRITHSMNNACHCPVGGQVVMLHLF